MKSELFPGKLLWQSTTHIPSKELKEKEMNK